MLKHFMLRHFAACLLGLAALLAALAGNSAYENVPRLQNLMPPTWPRSCLGFDVIEGLDLGKRDMEKRIRAYAEQLSGADVALLYYAGHGLQVDQKNFLAPIDAQLKSEFDLDFEAVSSTSC
jgi:uncharacterized caspase-like protein